MAENISTKYTLHVDAQNVNSINKVYLKNKERYKCIDNNRVTTYTD